MSKKRISPEIQAIISASDAGHHATTAALAESYLIANPESQKCWLDLGHALAQMSRFEAAESAFQKALDLDNDGPVDVIFGEMGNLFRVQGDLNNAAHWFEKQIEADPSDATGFLFLGNTYFQQGKHAAASKTLKEGLGCSLGCLEEVHYSLGLIERCKGNLQEAKSHFESAVVMDQKFSAAKTALKDIKTAISLA